MSKKAKPAKERPPKGVPLLHFLGDGSAQARERFERGLRGMLNRDSTLSAEQRADLERYLANPIRAGVQDAAGREEMLGELLDDRQHAVDVGTENLIKAAKKQSRNEDAKALRAVKNWRSDPVRRSLFLKASRAEAVRRYLKQARPPRRQAGRLKAMLENGRIK